MLYWAVGNTGGSGRHGPAFMAHVVEGAGLQRSCGGEEGTACRLQNPQGPEKGRLPEKGTEEACLKGEETGRGSKTGHVEATGAAS